MIHSAEWIEQPCSGQYVEKIYDIKSPWNSSKWTWIKFSDEDGVASLEESTEEYLFLIIWE